MNNHSTDIIGLETTAMDRVLLTDRNQTCEECSICFEVVTNRTFVNVCLHYFCHDCIVSWVQVKAACPLCVQPISSILTNVRSQDDYDVEPVVPPEVDVLANHGSDFSFPADSTDTESSYGEMESMDRSGSEFGNSFNELDFEDDDGSYHSEGFENIQTDSYYHSDNEQNDVESVVSEPNECISDEEVRDLEDGDDSYAGDNLDEYEDSDRDDNNNDEYEADDDEDDNDEENYFSYKYSEGANSDVEENNENMYFYDNLSYSNESEDNEEIVNDSEEEIASDSQEESARDFQEDSSDFHENSVSDSHVEYEYEDYREDEDDSGEDASERDEEKLDFDVDSLSDNNYFDYDEELSNHDYHDYDDAAAYLYSGYY